MKPYLKLLMAREGKEVLGHRYSNLWLLTIVLTAMFASIAFSHGSMLYLQDKMEDPFTNWVDIPIDGKGINYRTFANKLDDPKLKQRYGYSEVHNDCESYFDMVNGKKDMYAQCRHFASFNTDLVQKILDEDNVINGCLADSSLLHNDNSLGLILSERVVQRLGYDVSNPPSYVYYKAFNPDADSLGYAIRDSLMAIPWPVLAVVRRLPNNVDMMATNYLAGQPMDAAVHPFDFSAHQAYTSKLRYFVPATLDDQAFEAAVKSTLPDSLKASCKVLDENEPNLACWRPGKQVVLSFDNAELTSHQWIALDKQIQTKTEKEGVVRIYHYETGTGANMPTSYASIAFNNLDHIREFEAFAKEEHKVQLDMSLVASKENFSAVTVMARVLSSAMVLFSLVCIIMFLVNMLQSYFQKVKRNIGTFKAFGMNAAELIYVYTLILIMIVCSAVVMALVATWIIQLLLPLVGIEKDGFNYLSLWNSMTYVAAIVVVVSTVATVSIVMKRMLNQTPGDLIYDRN